VSNELHEANALLCQAIRKRTTSESDGRVPADVVLALSILMQIKRLVEATGMRSDVKGGVIVFDDAALHEGGENESSRRHGFAGHHRET
jgi:hypothetical protein